MLIFDHRAAELVAVPLLCLAFGWWLWRAVMAKRKLMRIPARVTAILIQSASCVLLLVNGCVGVTTITETSAPIYSPDGKHAIVVRDWDAGALGGASWVDLYSYAGLLEQHIAGGDWRLIEAENVHWLANDEVRLEVDPSYRLGANCVSTKSITVICEPHL